MICFRPLDRHDLISFANGGHVSSLIDTGSALTACYLSSRSCMTRLKQKHAPYITKHTHPPATQSGRAGCTETLPHRACHTEPQSLPHRATEPATQSHRACHTETQSLPHKATEPATQSHRTCHKEPQSLPHRATEPATQSHRACH